MALQIKKKPVKTLRRRIIQRAASYRPIVTKSIKQRVRHIGVEECVEDIFSTFYRLIDVPTTFMMLIAVAVICITHTDNLSEGFLRNMVDSHPDNRVLLFVKGHFKQSLGYAMFLAIIMDLPKSINRIAILLAAAFWVFMLPPFNIYQYAAHALIAHSYFRVSRRKSKVVLLAIAFVVFLFGHNYLGSFSHPKLTVPSTPHK